MFDLSSTVLALKLGLSEANHALIFIAQRLGIGLVGALISFKALFFVGAGLLILLGMKTRSPAISRAILAVIVGFAGVLALVSMNNLAAIIWAL